jgi:hypothetical protein
VHKILISYIKLISSIKQYHFLQKRDYSSKQKTIIASQNNLDVILSSNNKHFVYHLHNKKKATAITSQQLPLQHQKINIKTTTSTNTTANATTKSALIILFITATTLLQFSPILPTNSTTLTVFLKWQKKKKHLLHTIYIHHKQQAEQACLFKISHYPTLPQQLIQNR